MNSDLARHHGPISTRLPLPERGSPDVLLEALMQLAGCSEVAAAQRLCVRAARSLAGADAAVLVLREGDQCRFVEEDADRPLWKGRCLPLKDDVAGWALLEGRDKFVADLEAEPRLATAWYRPSALRSAAVIPFPGAAAAIGLYWNELHDADADDLDPLRQLARAAAGAIGQAQRLAQMQQQLAESTGALNRARDEIRKHAVTDEMTDLANRRGFYILGEHALRHAARRGLPCLLVKLDVDALGKINDRLGHHVGDALIVDVAQLLRDTFRASDIIARVDGDEFCVLVQDPGDDAQVIRRRIEDRVAVQQRAGKAYALTLHLGIACSDPDATGSLDELMARADAALYSSKHARKPRSAA
jgi:diguanylate cyclase (GGDEF)-like protein